MKNSKKEILAMMEEVGSQLGPATYKNILLANYMVPTRYPGYLTIKAEFGGVKSLRKEMAKAKLRLLAMKAYLDSFLST